MMERHALERIAAAVCCASLLLVRGPAAGQTTEGPTLALVDLDGNEEVLGVVPPSVFAPRVSPDGERVVFEILEPSAAGGGGAARLWIAELSDLDARRDLPSVDAPMNWAGLWTADGERIVFLASGERSDAIFWQSADGTEDGEHLVDGRSAESWTPGGAQLTYLTLRAEGDYGISLLDMESRATQVLIDLPGTAQHSSNVSPDGNWVAYASNQTGRFEVWVAPLSDPGDAYRVTQQGGGHPLWSRDGDSIYFDRERRLYEVEIETAGEEGVAVDEPRALPIAGFAQGEYRRQFDLMPDGRRFLVLLPPPGSAE